MERLKVDANQCAQCSCVLKTTTTTTSTTTTSTTSTTSTTTAQGGTTTPDWWGDDDSNQWVCPLHRQCRCNANAAPVYVLDQRGCRLSCTCRPVGYTRFRDTLLVRVSAFVGGGLWFSCTVVCVCVYCMVVNTDTLTHTDTHIASHLSLSLSISLSLNLSL